MNIPRSASMSGEIFPRQKLKVLLTLLGSLSTCDRTPKASHAFGNCSHLALAMKAGLIKAHVANGESSTVPPPARPPVRSALTGTSTTPASAPRSPAPHRPPDSPPRSSSPCRTPTAPARDSHWPRLPAVYFGHDWKIGMLYANWVKMGMPEN